MKKINLKEDAAPGDAHLCSANGGRDLSPGENGDDGKLRRWDLMGAGWTETKDSPQVQRAPPDFSYDSAHRLNPQEARVHFTARQKYHKVTLQFLQRNRKSSNVHLISKKGHRVGGSHSRAASSMFSVKKQYMRNTKNLWSRTKGFTRHRSAGVSEDDLRYRDGPRSGPEPTESREGKQKSATTRSLWIHQTL